MKKLRSKEIIIGIFTVLVFAGSYWGFNFLKNKKVFSDDIILYAVFNQADGLEVSAPVLVKGFRIGTVDKINFDINAGQLLVTLTIDGRYDLPSTSEAQIVSTSLLGGKVLEVTLGKEDTFKLNSGDTIRTSKQRSLMDNASEEYNKLKEQASLIVDKLNSALDGINQALSPENTAALSATMANLKSVSGNINDVVANEKANLEKIISNLAVLSSSLKASAPALERGIKNLATISDTIALHGPQLIANTAQSIDNLNQILTRINNGQGSVGKLVTDEELYTNVNAAVENLSLLIADLKANPKKYVNVTVFGGGKTKEERQADRKAKQDKAAQK